MMDSVKKLEHFVKKKLNYDYSVTVHLMSEKLGYSAVNVDYQSYVELCTGMRSAIVVQRNNLSKEQMMNTKLIIAPCYIHEDGRTWVCDRGTIFDVIYCSANEFITGVYDTHMILEVVDYLAITRHLVEKTLNDKENVIKIPMRTKKE